MLWSYDIIAELKLNEVLFI